MIVPRISGRTVQQSLMRDALAAITRTIRGNFDAHKGDVAGLDKFRIRKMAQEIVVSAGKTGIANDPTGWYRDIFFQRGAGIPMSTKLRILNQAPLAALGIGPKSWRAAQLAPRQLTTLSNEAKKGIAGMAIGSMLSPALDFVTKYVAPDPTDWWHVAGTVAKRTVSRGGAGALIGFGAGTTTTGVGGMPAAGAGALIGGFIGLAEGVFDAWSEVKEYELKTAEDLKRYND